MKIYNISIPFIHPLLSEWTIPLCIISQQKSLSISSRWYIFRSRNLGEALSVAAWCCHHPMRWHRDIMRCHTAPPPPLIQQPTTNNCLGRDTTEAVYTSTEYGALMKLSHGFIDENFAFQGTCDIQEPHTERGRFHRTVILKENVLCTFGFGSSEACRDAM